MAALNLNAGSQSPNFFQEPNTKSREDGSHVMTDPNPFAQQQEEAGVAQVDAVALPLLKY